ncbi:hypothetical protein DL765_010681 [Monosporascus sp. GIB2]|nr:hypothetical protein DL765_010681 [Monosporascus sp. GIB2]
MASRPRTQMIPESVWLQHKEIIIHLYLGEDYTIGTLAERMRAVHGLSATISQYERRLKVWNVRKNLNVHEWEPIIERIDRLPTDTQSRVILSGQPVPEHRIQRARRRCKSRSVKRPRLADQLEYSEVADVFIEMQKPDGTWSKLEETEALPATTGSPHLKLERAVESAALLPSDFGNGFGQHANALNSQGTLQHGLPHAYAIAAGPISMDSAYGSASVMESEFDMPRKRGDPAAAQSGQGPAEQDVDDATTEYYNASTTTFSRQESFIRGLADDLFSGVCPLNAHEDVQKRISAILPDLLKAFALKVGHNAPSQMHRDVMAFVHRHRREISTAFTDISFKQEEDPERITNNSDGMSLEERMSLWFQKESFQQVSLEEDLGLDDIGSQERGIGSNGPDSPDIEGEEVPESWLLAYRRFVFSTSAYEWLLTRLRREFRLVPTEPNTIRMVRDKVTFSLPSAHRISRKVLPQSSSVRFELDWDILEFFETQEYLKRPDEVLEGVITLIGSSQDAQAATCAQYINQTWPMTGEVTLQLVKGVIRGGESHPHLSKLSDGTRLSGWISGPKFMVQAYGVAASIAETGEQLAWLGAALRTSPRRSGLVYCTPTVTVVTQRSTPARLSEHQLPLADTICEIGFIIEEVEQPLQSPNGSAQAHHPVTHSGLPKPHAGCALADTFVSPGRMIMGGPAFDIGLKDAPAQVSRNGYIPRLKWISTKFVLLWDERDKRGWLINGTSALLHVVRASLAHNSTDKFRSAFLFKSEDLQKSPRSFTADSAIDVLINSKNLGLRLYPENNGYLLLGSQIDYFYNVLEKLINHQADIAGDYGRNLSDKPRRYLEGWDFEDLATNRDPLHPRIATLEARGKGWVDFVRAIRAITLVGRGFGDIIRPAGADICEYWAKLPKQQYYIASYLSDLCEAMKKHGSYGNSHVQLSDNLIWHTPTTVFGSCQCKGALGRDHYEPVQTLFPSALSNILLPRRHPIPLEGYGAVIFGHNSKFSWVWGDSGDPQEGELREAATSSKAAGLDSDSLRDSGIGPSLTKSGSEGQVSSRSRSSIQRSMMSPSEFHTNTAMPDSVASVDGETYVRRQYTVGILCALPKELMAVRALFDRKYDSLETALGDSNQYALGQMTQHMVVAACLPAGEYGTNSAATAASNMARSFPSIRFCLLVGIGGGAPSEENDIRLGDVVVSLPTNTFPGVIQYDLGKEREGSSFELTGTLQRPPRVLTTAINALRSDPDMRSDPLGPHLRQITARMPEYGHPGRELDMLFRKPCALCRPRQDYPASDVHVPQRAPRATDEPAIHYGLVASGNRVIKDAAFRDRLAREYGVLCFEMEAAGVVNTFPCLVIRGVCDYCDVNKNDAWQEYAAATAAAYAKLLLGVVARAAGSGDTGKSLKEGSTRLHRGYEEEGWEPPSKRRKA